ncbi:hypothetical protein, partial [Streptomyces sp. NPDC005568]|uniref:hypothetical protein n=1 Tax=Streptomyces sp. NPDC005568 TaxID=3156887 RepID=UPI0033BD47A0
EMYAIDSSDAWQEGCANTLLVAEQIDTSGMFGAVRACPCHRPSEDERERDLFFAVDDVLVALCPDVGVAG